MTVGGNTYLVGGYTGSTYASAVLRYDGGGRTSTVARLPEGLRYAGVAALDGTIYVAGGLTTAGETSAVLAVDPASGHVRRVATLRSPIAYGALVAFQRRLFMIGGKTSAGIALATVQRIDPSYRPSLARRPLAARPRRACRSRARRPDRRDRRGIEPGRVLVAPVLSHASPDRGVRRNRYLVGDRGMTRPDQHGDRARDFCPILRP